MEPDGVPPVEEDALDQGHHGPGAVEAGADYANLQNFALGHSGFLENNFKKSTLTHTSSTKESSCPILN